MIGPMIEHARLTVETTIAHYIGRLAVLIPIAVSAAFGTAAGYLILEERTGAIQACAIMACVFVILALIVAMIVLVQERHQKTLLRQTAQQSAMMAGLMTAAPVALAGGGRLARLIGLKGPLLLGSALLAAAMLARPNGSDVQT